MRTLFLLIILKTRFWEKLTLFGFRWFHGLTLTCKLFMFLTGTILSPIVVRVTIPILLILFNPIKVISWDERPLIILAKLRMILLTFTRRRETTRSSIPFSTVMALLLFVMALSNGVWRYRLRKGRGCMRHLFVLMVSILILRRTCWRLMVSFFTLGQFRDRGTLVMTHRKSKHSLIVLALITLALLKLFLLMVILVHLSRKWRGFPSVLLVLLRMVLLVMLFGTGLFILLTLLSGLVNRIVRVLWLVSRFSNMIGRRFRGMRGMTRGRLSTPLTRQVFPMTWRFVLRLLVLPMRKLLLLRVFTSRFLVRKRTVRRGGRYGSFRRIFMRVLRFLLFPLMAVPFHLLAGHLFWGPKGKMRLRHRSPLPIHLLRILILWYYWQMAFMGWKLLRWRLFLSGHLVRWIVVTRGRLFGTFR